MSRSRHAQHGFSIIELMVAMAILGIVAAVSVPNLKDWSKAYQLKSASTNLYSHMQIAKLGAVKDNQPWTVNFNPGGLTGYEIRNSAGTVIKTVNFSTNYNGQMQYSHPTSSTLFESATLTFNPNGTTGTGFGYLSNKSLSGYYRVGLLLPNGAIRLQKWNGSLWE